MRTSNRLKMLKRNSELIKKETFSGISSDTQDVLASVLAHGCAEFSRSSLFIHYCVSLRIFSCCFSRRSLRRLLPLIIEKMIGAKYPSLLRLLVFVKALLVLKWMRAKGTRLLWEQHVSEDPTRKCLVLSEEAEAVPAESEHSVADIHNTQVNESERNETPAGTARV